MDPVLRLWLVVFFFFFPFFLPSVLHWKQALQPQIFNLLPPSVKLAERESTRHSNKTCLKGLPGLSPAQVALLELPIATELTGVKRVKDMNLFNTRSLSWWENVLPGTQQYCLSYYS